MHAAAMPVLDARETTALAIWTQHVALRQPMLLDSVLETDDFQQLSRWTNQYLHDRVVRHKTFADSKRSATL
jgi:hypothetical protein